MAVTVGLRNDLVRNHEDHRPGRQPQTERIGNGKATGNADADQGTEGLHQPGSDGTQGSPMQSKRPQ